jgi:hypothetical protein
MYNEFHNQNNNYMQITSLFFLAGVIYFASYSKKKFGECTLALVLFVCFIISEVFWSNPIRFSKQHIIDGIYAKFTIACFIVYTLCFKKMNALIKMSYIFLILLLAATFYYSDLHSSKDWCCDEHVFYHGLMHLVGFIGSAYAFYPY